MFRKRNRKLSQPVHDGDHIQGDPSAPVVLVAYGDFECPYSRIARQSVRAIQKDYGDKVAFVYRHFPLTDIHPLAEPAAHASEAAAAQGKFWEMYDRIFVHQTRLNDTTLREHAANLALDLEQFDAQWRGGDFNERVQADVQSGKASGVHSTPSFFVNGTYHKGLFDLDDLRAAVAAALGSS